MKLSFFGADREVTGSCHGVEIRGKNILVDCGMLQGSDNGNKQDFPFNPAGIDYVVMTHAHIDHSGRLPLLVKQGFTGKIFATGATANLLEIMLRDSAHIQEVEAGWRSKKGKRAGRQETPPLYTMEDAEAVFQYIERHVYNEIVDIDEGVKNPLYGRRPSAGLGLCRDVGSRRTAYLKRLSSREISAISASRSSGTRSTSGRPTWP